MRIITGKFKGRLIKMPQGMRPTQDKVRKALFDILGGIEGASFLELFAGSGAVGLEAASQGVKEVVFVENDPTCIKMLKENLSYLSLTAYRLLPIDAFKAVERLAKEKEKFDIVFLDPPYYKDMVPRLRPSTLRRCSVSMVSVAEPSTSLRTTFGRSGSMASRDDESLSKKTLKILSTYDILALDGLIVVQHFKKDNLPDVLGDLVLFKQVRYGDTMLSFYRKEG